MSGLLFSSNGMIIIYVVLFFSLVVGSKPAGCHGSIVTSFSNECVKSHDDSKPCADLECSGQDGVDSLPVEEDEVGGWSMDWAHSV